MGMMTIFKQALGDNRNSDGFPNIPLLNSLVTLSSRMENITEKVAKSFEFGQEVSESIHAVFEKWEQAVIKAEVFAFNVKSALEILQQVSASLANIVANISIPSLSEERKQAIRKSHCRWGELGWTWFQDAPMDLYDNPPLDIKDANARVKYLCSTQSLENIFNQLRAQKIRQEDLESAIFCFRNRQYKACALLLFGLIDAKMIREQPRNEGKRSVGVKAVKQLRTHFEENEDKQALYTVLFRNNLFACLETIFAYGNDFREEPNVINRNFLNHGMNRKRIRKRDCIQLFLVLNNLMQFLSEDIILNAS